MMQSNANAKNMENMRKEIRFLFIILDYILIKLSFSDFSTYLTIQFPNFPNVFESYIYP